VLRTRVGYAGGKKQNPTYHDLGDQTECFELDFDPKIIGYRELVKMWLEQFHPGSGSWSRQYISLLFYRGDEQRKIALEEGGARAEPSIVAHERFWLAENYHQKYYLRHSPLLKELGTISDAELIDSTLAARLNGFAGGFGSEVVLEAELASYALSPEGEKRLRSLATKKRL
jgi:peptide-methionine (S)-S-oxide reductase